MQKVHGGGWETSPAAGRRIGQPKGAKSYLEPAQDLATAGLAGCAEEVEHLLRAVGRLSQGVARADCRSVFEQIGPLDTEYLHTVDGLEPLLSRDDFRLLVLAVETETFPAGPIAQICRFAGHGQGANGAF